jgi:hypothetical protein
MEIKKFLLIALDNFKVDGVKNVIKDACMN